MLSKSFIALAALIASTSALPRKRQVDNGPTEGWEDVGCYTDSAVPRTLIDASFADAEMTPALCTAFCEAGGYGFAGVEYGLECYCGYVIQPTGALTTAAECSVPCGGDPTLTCGAGNRMYIYTNGQAPPSAPATVGEWEYQGCYTDFENQTRTLLRVIELSGPATIETCTAGCKSEGHRFAGLEYGGECWCGDELLSGGPTAESECAMTCAGDRTQICGGPFRLTLYLDTEAPVPEPEEPEEPTPEEPEPEEPTPEEPEPEEPTPEEPEEPEPTPEEPEEPTPEEPEEPEEPAPEEPEPTPEEPEEPAPEEPEEPAPEDPEPVPEEPEEPVPEDPFPEEPLPTA